MRLTSLSICLILSSSAAFGADKDEKAEALAKILIQDDDDLPDGVTGTAAKTDQKDAPILFRQMPKAQVFAFRELEEKGEPKGSVTAFTYPSSTTRTKAFKTLSSDMGKGATKLDGIGEKAVSSTTVVDVAGFNYSIADIAFTRGNHVVFVRFIGKAPAEDAKAHAKRLDERLQKTAKK